MMKHLLIDFIKRWKWWLAAAVAFQLTYTVAVLLGAKTDFFFWILTVAAPGFLSYDLQNGMAKIHSLLPIPRRTIEGNYWIQAVLLPTAVVSAGVLIASIVTGAFKPSAFEGLNSLPHIALISFAFSGTLYFILTLMPLAPQPGTWGKLLAGVGAGCWILVAALGILLFSNKSIYQWSSSKPIERIPIAVGVVLGIVSFFTSRHLLSSQATFRPGSYSLRERTDPRWIRFPDRTVTLLEPWITTVKVSLVFVLGIAAVFVLIFTYVNKGDVREAIREILEREGAMGNYWLTMIIVFSFFTGVRSLLALRLLRTLPLTGWELTGAVVSFPAVALFASWSVLSICLVALGRLDALGGFTRVFLLTMGPLLLGIALLMRLGMKAIIVGMGALFGFGVAIAIFVSGDSAESTILSWPVATLSAVLLSAVGTWIIHGAITGRSQTYHPTSFAGPQGLGR